MVQVTQSNELVPKHYRFHAVIDARKPENFFQVNYILVISFFFPFCPFAIGLFVLSSKKDGPPSKSPNMANAYRDIVFHSLLTLLVTNLTCI